MYTIDINGSSPREKKLLLSISENDFLESMIFNSEQEKEDCIKYLHLKGVSYHVILANYIGFDNQGKVLYKHISTLYQYDKRIRNILYKFLSAFEEGIRAFICNHYSNKYNTFPHLNKLIIQNIQKGSDLSKELERLEFSELLNLSRKIPNILKKNLFGSIVDLKDNLDAVRELRNAVSHHRLLFVYEDFEVCLVNYEYSNSLIKNIENLYNLLPDYYKPFFKEQINDSCNDKYDLDFRSNLPPKVILSF